MTDRSSILSVETAPQADAITGVTDSIGAALGSGGSSASRIFIHTSHGKALFDTLSARVEGSIPSAGGAYSVMDFHREAMAITVDDVETSTFAVAATALARAATLGVQMNEAMAVFLQPRTPILPRGDRARSGQAAAGRAPSPSPSMASFTSSTAPPTKRTRVDDATPSPAPAGAGGDEGIASLGANLVEAASARTAHASVFSAHTSIEAEHFSPILVEANLARRAVCAEIERIGALLVEVPAEKILAISSSEFARAPLREGADEESSPAERERLVSSLVESFESLRKAGCKLKASVSHAMRVYWLANHTAGASWDTVAQLCFREEWDRRMAAVTDGYTPLQSWDDKVAAAMRAIKQDRHLTKDGVPIGPVCPRLARKVGTHGGTPGGRDHQQVAPCVNVA
jgi:hypothetical protein